MINFNIYLLYYYIYQFLIFSLKHFILLYIHVIYLRLIVNLLSQNIDYSYGSKNKYFFQYFNMNFKIV